MPAGVLLPLGARPQNQLFLLRPQPFQAPHAAVAARGLELLDRLDAELRVQQGNRFRADALQVEQVENRRRELLEQILVITRLAGLGNLADLRSQILADAGDGAELLFAEIGKLVGRVRDGLGRVPVRANLERVLALDFEEIGDLREDARDGQVFHVSRETQRRRLYAVWTRRPSVSIR